jgi:hypothetical protein
MANFVALTEEEALRLVRNELRAELIITRGRYTLLGWLPACAVCGLAMRFPLVHEAIISSHDVLDGNFQVKRAILVPENCILVHNGRCFEELATPRGRERSIRRLIEEVGLGNILRWLDEIKPMIGADKIEQARMLLATRHSPSGTEAVVSKNRRKPS